MKRFKTLLNDSDSDYGVWQVWGHDGHRLTYIYAEFRGKFARRYAIEHAKRLNGLPKKDRPE